MKSPTCGPEYLWRVEPDANAIPDHIVDVKIDLHNVGVPWSKTHSH